MNNIEKFSSYLIPGDVILSLGDKIISKTLSDIFDMKYSHAMLYIGNNKIIEAVGSGGVKITNLKHYTNKDFNLALLRLKYNPTPNKLIKNIKKYLGIPYSFLGVLRGIILQIIYYLFHIKKEIIYKIAGKDIDKNFFCTELIAQIIYDTYNSKIKNINSDLITTKNLYDSKLFNIIYEI